MSGRYLEDFAVGQTFRSGRLRISKEQIKVFAAEFDPHEYFDRRSLIIKRGLRFCRQRTELLVCLHHVRLREGSGDECFRQSFVRLPRIGRKAKRDPASRFHDAPYFLQSSHGVRPDLHRVDRQRLINAVVIEWQALHGTRAAGRQNRS